MLKCMHDRTKFPAKKKKDLSTKKIVHIDSSFRGNAYCIGLHISFEGALPKHIWGVFLRKKGIRVHF